MPQLVQDAADNESRNSVIGARRSLNTSRTRDQLFALHSTRKSRRRNQPVGERDVRDFVPLGSNFTRYSALETPPTNPESQASSPSSTGYRAQSPTTMEQSGFGHNRLKSGFSKPQTPQDTGDEQEPAEVDEDMRDTIQISDDDTDEEMPDSELDGGITLNLQGTNSPEHILISDDETDDNESEHEEQGESEEVLSPAGNSTPKTNLISGNSAERSSQDDYEPSFVIDPLPSRLQTQMKLVDLSPEQLEKQLKYAFWNFDRGDIDLNRPVLCLLCNNEGHTDDSCVQRSCIHCGSYNKHDSRLCPSAKRCNRCREQGHEGNSCMKNTTIPCDLCGLLGHVEEECALIHHTKSNSPNGQLKLWVSCCVCASKTHLVGDCPGVNTARAARWSLKSLDSTRIANLSLETGTREREKEVENRGMRPAGLQIKGQAARNRERAAQADRQRAALDEDEESEDDFLLRAPPHHGLPSRPPQNATSRDLPHRHDQYWSRSNDRYDRFDAPSNDRRYRPPRNEFYATDSFGRPRSRSPLGRRQNPFEDRRRRSPPQGDSWRPGDAQGRRQPSPHRPRDSQPRAPTVPKQNLKIQLPQRRGFDDSTNSAKPASVTSNQNKHKGKTSAQNVNTNSSAQKPKNKKKEEKKRGNKGSNPG